MHTDEPREVQGVELGYDPRDIDAPRLYRVVAYFFVFALIFFGGGAIWYVYIGKVETSQHFDTRKPRFEGPKVQGNITAKVDIMEMRQTERRQMETYGTNPDGKQRIPVAQAMKVLAGRGLPAIADDKQAVSPGNTIPQNATGPAGTTTPTTPDETTPVPTPDQGPGAAGTTAGGATGTTTP